MEPTTNDDEIPPKSIPNEEYSLGTVVKNWQSIAKYEIFLCILLTIVLMITLPIMLALEPAPFYMSGLGRLLMSRVLVYCDWGGFKNEMCLIKKHDLVKPESFGCSFCESILHIPQEFSWDADELKDIYLTNHIPVVVKYNGDYAFTNLSQFYQNVMLDEELIGTRLCEFESNMFIKNDDLLSVIERTVKTDRYFFHFRLCQFEAVKCLRKIIPRPNFLAEDLNPVQHTWILASSNYKVGKFKKVQLVDQFSGILQLVGSNLFRLTARGNCGNDCSDLEIMLDEGEAILLSSLWDVEYRPSKGDNLAVILETR